MLDKIRDFGGDALLFVYMQFLIVCFVFGSTSYLYKVKQEKISRSWFNFISELFFSIVAGYISFNVCKHLEVSINLLWVFVSISAWSGVRFLNFMEVVIEKYITKKFGLEDVEETTNKED